MCGRFVASRPVEDLADLFEVDDIDVPEELRAPRWNVAPQAGVLAVSNRTTDVGVRRRLADFRWGLVPSWAKDVGVGARAFNARAETVREKPAFRKALAKRRCLIPADAFFEWKRTFAPGSGRGGRREPWCFAPADGGVMVFAGLYEVWRSPEPTHDAGFGWHDDWLLTCSIITTDANAVVTPIHNRMPVILDPADWPMWLDAGTIDPDELATLLRPAAEGVIEGFPVSSAVNNSRVDGPELVEPVASVLDEQSGRLALGPL